MYSCHWPIQNIHCFLIGMRGPKLALSEESLTATEKTDKTVTAVVKVFIRVITKHYFFDLKSLYFFQRHDF